MFPVIFTARFLRNILASINSNQVDEFFWHGYNSGVCSALPTSGIDHTKRTFTHRGRPERLTDPDVTGARVVEELLV